MLGYYVLGYLLAGVIYTVITAEASARHIHQNFPDDYSYEDYEEDRQTDMKVTYVLVIVLNILLWPLFLYRWFRG